MRKLVQKPERAQAMGMAAARSVQDGMTWDDYGTRLVSWLRQNVK